MTGQGKQAIDLALAESFKELASRHPIEKITIKDITDKPTNKTGHWSSDQSRKPQLQSHHKG